LSTLSIPQGKSDQTKKKNISQQTSDRPSDCCSPNNETFEHIQPGQKKKNEIELSGTARDEEQGDGKGLRRLKLNTWNSVSMMGR